MRLLHLEWNKLNPRAGLGFALSLVGVVLIAPWGNWVVFAGLAAMFLWMSDLPGTLRQRLGAVAAFAAASILVTPIAHRVADQMLPSLVFIFAVGFLGTAVMAWGVRAHVTGWVLIFWAILAQAIGTTLPASDAILGLAIGAVAVAALMVAGAWIRVEPRVDLAESPPPAVARLPVDMAYASIIGSVLALTSFIGFRLLSTFPGWMAISALVVIGPDIRQVWFKGVQRVLGTVLGITFGGALAGWIPSIEGLLLGAAVAAFVLVWVGRVNYVVMAFALTVFLSLGWALRGPEYAATASVERILAELVGIGIAVGAVFVLQRIVGESECANSGRATC